MNWQIDNNGIFVRNNEHKISYPEQGNQDCYQMEENSSWFDQRNELILTLIQKHKLKGNFLDIGGGNGYQVNALLKNSYYGEVYLCEPGYNGCLNAKKRGVKNVYNGFFQDFPFEEKNIKITGLFDVIEHIEDDILFLNQLYEKLPIDSYVLINVPASMLLWSQVDEFAGHFRRYSKNDIERISSKTKFKIIDSGFYFSFYVIPLLLLRVIPNKLGFNKTYQEVVKNETRNHRKDKGIITKMINWRHKIKLQNIYKNKTASIGTSMFFVLHKD